MPEQHLFATNVSAATERSVHPTWRDRLLSHIPPGQFLKYLCVGAFNTLFGYSTFAVINYVLHRHGVPTSYLFAYAISNIINITVAFFGYKLFVFQTRGDYLSEWLKAMAVYWSGIIPALLLLPILVRIFNSALPSQIALLHHTYSRTDAAPYVANAVLLGVGIVYSFLGHKNVTFRRKVEQAGAAGSRI